MSNSTKKIHQDPTEAALSAIQEALSLEAGDHSGWPTGADGGQGDHFELPPAREPKGPRIEVRARQGFEDTDFPKFDDEFAAPVNPPAPPDRAPERPIVLPPQTSLPAALPPPLPERQAPERQAPPAPERAAKPAAERPRAPAAPRPTEAAPARRAAN
ncbi:MAG TPA: hypothetical protein VLA00_19295, partial [Xanthobacteraceae bacterium]|nr:hypothetical protein [Xanthobacteraceae bacterium]